MSSAVTWRRLYEPEHWVLAAVLAAVVLLSYPFGVLLLMVVLPLSLGIQAEPQDLLEPPAPQMPRACEVIT